MENKSSTLVFYVNGKKVTDGDVDPSMTLLEYLRLKLRLCGTKLGCGEGGCGACTVMVSNYDRQHKTIQHLSVNACLAPVCSLHGLAVTTVEGIGSTRNKLHPVQERIAKAHGSQCGFCTPGIVMSMYTLLRNNSRPTVEDLEVTFQGNLCRCTGYRPILQGYLPFTQGGCCQNGSLNGGGCGQMSNGSGGGCCREQNGEAEEEVSEFVPYEPTQEPIFPSELQLSDLYDSQYLDISKGPVRWLRPTTWEQLLQLKAEHPQAKLVVGNTEVGVEVKLKKQRYPLLLAPGAIPQLKEVSVTQEGLTLGAAVTLSQLDDLSKQLIGSHPGHQTRVLKAIVHMLNMFAGKQIRNVGCIGGNIMTASPISDMNPIFLAAGCTLVAASTSGERTIAMDSSFFPGYRRTQLRPDEVLKTIHIPFTQQNEYFYAFKQAKRRDDDIAIVNAAFKVTLGEGEVVEDVKMAYGGMAPVTVMPQSAPCALKGRKWSEESTLRTTLLELERDLPLSGSAPGGMVEFRRALTTSFFFKCHLMLKSELGREVGEREKSALELSFHRHAPQGSQYYQLPPDGQPRQDLVGRPIVHLSAYKQATGEAVYCDDIPQFENELHLALVTSKRAHAKVLSVDPSLALQRAGVVDFISYKDAVTNIIGTVFKDEEVFASDKVTCQGHLIGAVVARDRKTAQQAADEVQVEYEDLQPIIITIEQAIERDSFKGHEIYAQNGDPAAGLALSKHVVEGEMRVGAQEHFYLETHAAIAVPKNEDGEMEVISSCQGLTTLQMELSRVLGVPANRIVCKAKRLGGGFGGKESRSWLTAIPCAIAAKKLGVPVRCSLDRDEDMVISGNRHPFLGRYKVGFDDEGRLLAVDSHFYSNIGHSHDLSLAVMERCVLSFENGYFVPNIRGTGHLCLTNLPSNTAFRGFGAPQGMIVMEDLMDKVAHTLRKDPALIRQLNLFEEGQRTVFKQPLVNCTMRRCWEECLTMSDYWARRKLVDQFNRENRWRKRGLAIIPTKFAICFDIPFLNQAGALVHVYRDGSVLISHGGIEMGQGLHTKMLQVAGRALGIDTAKIHIGDTSTDKVPNTSPSAASVSSDLNGMAILHACTTIKQRLEPVVAANPKGSWEQWISAAYLQCISLSATGYYAVPPSIDGFNWETQTGTPFLYFSYGAGCSEVEVDCLTGDHHVIRTDIVMDVGESLNPSIDVGQIEGAFIQGYGLFTLEEHRFSPEGFLYTRGPGTYKIPAFSDIPNQLNVALLKGAPNPRAVYSSKAVGEPPLFLSASAYFAIKDAIGSARREEGYEGYFRLSCPATAEKIRMACVDSFTKQFPPEDPATYKPWSYADL